VLNALFQNDSGNMRLNGEAWLLSQLSNISTSVFDVGAHKGDWTREALERLPNASVHSFEPIPETFVDLTSRFAGDDRVQLNNVALSNQLTELRMWADERDGTMSSATAPPGRSSQELFVRCTTGDDYIRSRAIDHIDILKIDVEGHEMEVLQGFEQAFEGGAVDVVQFEFTLWAAVARRWLADYYQFFAQWDFRIGKLWPRSIRWKEYAAEDEQFFRNNFVAVRCDSKAAHVLGVS
jgi:FkbM family methyltransferase